MERCLVRPDLHDYSPASNLALNEVIKNRRKEGNVIYHLGFGESPFPIPKFAVDTLREHAGDNSYLPVSGIPELRESICDFHRSHDGVSYSPDNAIVGPGSKELIFLLLEIFNGDVILKSPSWTTYKPQTVLTRHRVHIVETSMENQWKLKAEDIEKLVIKEGRDANYLMIFCNPDNPTGVSYSYEELKELSVVLRKYRIVVLSDEIYGRVHYEGNFVTLAKVAIKEGLMILANVVICQNKLFPEGTILSSGLSKWASCGGWRLGYHLYPRELKQLYEAVRSAGSHSYSCASAPVQRAAVKLFNDHKSSKEYMDHINRIHRQVRNYVVRELTSVDVKVEVPSASFYMFPDFEVLREKLLSRDIHTCEQMCSALLEEASVVLMAGGPAFLRPTHELTTRLCFIDYDGSVALAESRRIGLDKSLPETFVADYCNHLYSGIQALKNWVKQQLQG